ncbi:MAG: HAD family hydrolase [Eubacterium sp.]|nr:HAD family hydrolase [Eubacterium sp.]
MKISFDLDEVLFVKPDTYETEPALRFPYNRLYPERLRKGTVKLINDLQADGFEVWVYTSSFRTAVYIKSLFRHYGVKFDDIVNGYRHRDEVQGQNSQPMPQKVPNRYRISLHIDDEEGVVKNAPMYGFRAMQVYDPDDEWAEKVMAEARRVRELEEKQAAK